MGVGDCPLISMRYFFLLLLCLLALGCQRSDEFCNTIAYDLLYGSEPEQDDALDRLVKDPICMRDVRRLDRDPGTEHYRENDWFCTVHRNGKLFAKVCIYSPQNLDKDMDEDM